MCYPIKWIQIMYAGTIWFDLHSNCISFSFVCSLWFWWSEGFTLNAWEPHQVFVLPSQISAEKKHASHSLVDSEVSTIFIIVRENGKNRNQIRKSHKHSGSNDVKQWPGGGSSLGHISPRISTTCNQSSNMHRRMIIWHWIFLGKPANATCPMCIR